MKKVKKITEELSSEIKKQEATFNSKESTLGKANDMYNDLLKRGVIKRRGYTLKGLGGNNFFQIGPK